VVKAKTKCMYAGSPLQYSKSEIGYTKKLLYCRRLKVGEEATIQTVPLKNYKPIEVWNCSSVEESNRKNARIMLIENVGFYLEIKTDKYITQEDIKAMKSLKDDILEIKPIIIGQEDIDEEFFSVKEKSMHQLFKDFYTKQRMTEPNQEVMDLFLNILEQGEDEYEA
jgi:DNA repair exonuclease